MTRHVALDSETHRALRIRTDASAELGDGVMASLAVPREFRRLAVDFPILFRRDPATGNFSALALFGFEAGENLFLAEGRWNSTGRPLAQAIQPFLVGRSRDGSGPAQVHIDLDHPRVSEDGEGVRLFDDEGQPTPFLEDAAAMLGELDEGYRESAGFYEALQRYELLEPFSLDVETGDGGKQRLVGYHLIDEEKLRALEPGALADLHSAGHLMPLFMALASVGNLSKLARRKVGRAGG